MSRHEFVHSQFVGTRALGHFQEFVHGGQFLELLVEEPTQEILGDVIALLAGASMVGISSLPLNATT